MSESASKRIKLHIALLCVGLLCIAIYLVGLLLHKIQTILGISDAVGGFLMLCFWLVLSIRQFIRDGRRDETQKLFAAVDGAENSSKTQ
jgi:uncharacterized membrane protein YgdD (TMEM256/DUF423 family)